MVNGNLSKRRLIGAGTVKNEVLPGVSDIVNDIVEKRDLGSCQIAKSSSKQLPKWRQTQLGRHYLTYIMGPGTNLPAPFSSFLTL